MPKRPARHCVDCGLTTRTYRCGVCTLREAWRRDVRSLAGTIEYLRDRCMCAYCGESATDREHVVPRSLGGTYTVPACGECNLLAGTGLDASLAARRRRIRQAFERRYRRVLRCPEWDREELAEMGCGMRQAIEAQEAARQILCQRLDFMRAADMLSELVAELAD